MRMGDVPMLFTTHVRQAGHTTTMAGVDPSTPSPSHARTQPHTMGTVTSTDKVVLTRYMEVWWGAWVGVRVGV